MMDLSRSSHNHLVPCKAQQARVVKSECCGLFKVTAMEGAADCFPPLIEYFSPAKFSQIRRKHNGFSFLSCLLWVLKQIEMLSTFVLLVFCRGGACIVYVHLAAGRPRAACVPCCA